MIRRMTTINPRPLSPHLQVYRLPLTAKMSITHRMTGVILMGGLLLMAGWLIAAVLGEEYYAHAMVLAVSPLGQIILFVWAAAFYYHLCNGIRHLFWDMGFLFKLQAAAVANWVVLIATAALTAGTWFIAQGGAL